MTTICGSTAYAYGAAVNHALTSHTVIFACVYLKDEGSEGGSIIMPPANLKELEALQRDCHNIEANRRSFAEESQLVSTIFAPSMG